MNKDYTEEAKELAVKIVQGEYQELTDNEEANSIAKAVSDFTQQEVKKAVDGFEKSIALNVSAKEQISQLQFELKAADKENERLTKENEKFADIEIQLRRELAEAKNYIKRLTKENKELNKDLNLKIKQRQNWYESYHEKSEQLQQKETELKELKEGIEKIKALKIVEVQEITDTLLTK